MFTLEPHGEAMSDYSKPADVFSGKIGRKLEDRGTIPRSYFSYTEQLREGEALYMAFRPSMRVVKVPSAAHYNQFYRQYLQDIYGWIGLYALPE
jgi:hypothetical protein